MPRFSVLPLCAVLAALVANTPATAGVTLEGDTCRQVFDNPRAEKINCRTGFRLDPATRGKLESSTFGFLTDLTCAANLTATRSEVVARVHAGGDVALPQQEIRCRLYSGSDPVNVRFHLAPVVRIDKKSRRAVDARLGVRDVTGIPEPLATAVAQFLNSEPTLRKSLIAAANQIIPNLPGK
ncbi:conserved hypothetical protein [Solidesulfovibrio fructosivorans JJ]]|uniref:Lipoprotein n=1 Tax=Solidesulfovibrio fructosivorans JJ] TaxID=596151 RepID=E1JV38_SOLFR|nr:hypothetical protein [Solidesulfovibrio fructosivorans]EFL51632.1 conserved hypothetical protein [Solidesulfovibrio fructosivorans JJ]]